MGYLEIGAALALASVAPPQAGSPEQAPQGEAALPDLNVKPGDYADARKYFIFYKPGVTVERAEADLAFCWRFLPHGMSRRLPDFVPWRKPAPAAAIPYSNGQFGIAGAVIGAIISGPIERSLRQSRLFRCMVPRGYARYRTSEDVWKALNSGDAAASIRLQARIAAGAEPPTARIEP